MLQVRHGGQSSIAVEHRPALSPATLIAVDTWASSKTRLAAVTAEAETFVGCNKDILTQLSRRLS